MVIRDLPKVEPRVRFPLPAPKKYQNRTGARGYEPANIRCAAPWPASRVSGSRSDTVIQNPTGASSDSRYALQESFTETVLRGIIVAVTYAGHLSSVGRAMLS